MTRARPRRRLPLPVLLGLAAFACAHAPAQRSAPVLPVAYVGEDTVWSGDVHVGGVVHVRKAATLTIAPGTHVHFSTAGVLAGDSHDRFAGPGIKVEGRVVAVGTEDSPIVFTSEAFPVVPASWDKIYFSFSEGNRFEHCVFEGARYAFHAHFSGITVERCVFRENEEGVRLGTSRVRIRDSVFTRNLVRGINFRECRNEITGNLVYGNGDGIFLHSKTAGSVIRGNAVYGNRNFNLRLGDLHDGDVDVAGNWWGTADPERARRTILDGATTPGVGSARLEPVLRASPVAGAEIRGVFAVHLLPVAGAEVRAYDSVASGFWTDGAVATTRTDGTGRFRLPVPPGRYFVVGKADSAAGALFAFPGRNPVSVLYGETADVGLPAVTVPSPAAPAGTPASRPSIAIRATLDGSPVAGATVQASRPDRPDFRGPGEASAVTGADGSATLYLPPGKYLLAAKKRTTGAALGMVDEGGLFGVYPASPVDLPAGTAVAVEIPMFEKRGLLEARGGGDAGARSGGASNAGEALLEGSATLGGRPAEGHIVFFYRPPETIGRPAARSSVVTDAGRFTALLPGPGEYAAFLRKAIPGIPGGAEEERAGPVPVRVEDGRLAPPVLPFDANAAGSKR